MHVVDRLDLLGDPLAGAADDGTPFVAKVRDAGEPGIDRDTVTLWIDGVLQPGSGVIAAGNLQRHT